MSTITNLSFLEVAYRKAMEDWKDSVQNGPIPQNQEELIESIEQAWEDISKEIIEILIASMPKRMRAVIDAKGGSIRW